jgi:hypothetical protein
MLHFDAFQHLSRTRAVRPVIVMWKQMFPHQELQHLSGARESIALKPVVWEETNVA